VERLGRYELLRRIAVGGMAEIFVAREVGLAGFERPAIVKRILPAFAEDEKFVELFVDEARVVAHLAHPNITHIYELGFEGGSYFIAMELVRGCDLQSLLSAVPGPMPLPLDEAVYIASEVLEGLQHAHRLLGPSGRPLGIVHRDIAPKNVLVSLDGAVKVVDFGIAKARIKLSVTAPGLVMGTYGYMSPEQATAQVVDHRTDVFATGAMLYRMLTGRDAYQGTEIIDIIDLAQRGDYPSPREVQPGLPEALEQVILRAMAVDPEDRYPSASHMRRDLGAISRQLGLDGDAESLAGLIENRMPHLEGLVRSWLAPSLDPDPGVVARDREGPSISVRAPIAGQSSDAAPSVKAPHGHLDVPAEPTPQPHRRQVEGGVRWEELARRPGRERVPVLPPLFGEDTDEDVDDDAETRDLTRKAAGLPAIALDDESRDTWPMDMDEHPFGSQHLNPEDPLSEEIYRRPATEGVDEDTETELGRGPDESTEVWGGELSLPELPEDVERELSDSAPDEGPTIEDLDLDDEL